MKNNYRILNRLFLAAAIFAAGIFGAAAEARAAGVALSANPAAATVTAGQSASYTININRDGYKDKVTLSATNLPAGATAVFNPNTTPANSSVLTVKTLSSTPAGTFIINVKAFAPGVSIAPITVKLTVRAAPAIAVTANPGTQSIVAGQSTYYDIAIDRTNFDGPVTLSAEELPAGMTVRFEPETTYGGSSRMYLYSNGLPFISKDYSLILRARAIDNLIEGRRRVYVIVNCGIQWAQQFAMPNAPAALVDRANDVTLDAAGNVYVVGDTLANANWNVFVTKFNSAGVRQWTRVIDSGSDEEFSRKVAVDVVGNVYVAGYFKTGASFVNYDIFLAKLASDGTVINSHALGGNDEDGTGGMILSTDAAANVALTAVVDVRRRAVLNYGVTRFGFSSNFLSTGTTRLLRDRPGNPRDLALAPDGSIFVVGDDDINGMHAGFIDKFAPAGNPVWREPVTNFYGEKVITDANGNAFAAFYDSSSADAKLIKFDAAHSAGMMPAWTHLEATIRSAQIRALTIDNGGEVIFGGKIDENGWISRHSNASGGELFRNEFAVLDSDGFNSIKVGANLDVYVAGETVNFTPVRFGNLDALVMKFSLAYCLVLGN